MSKKNIHISWGSIFPSIVPWLAIGGFIYGIYVLQTSWFLGAFMTVSSFLMIALREGVIIDPRQQRLKSYWGLLGLKFGEWKSIEKYPYLVVLRSEGKYDEDEFTEISSGISGQKVIHFDLYLMSANHLRRIMISSYEQKQEALEAARILSEDLGLEFVKYNPGQTVHQKRY